MVAFSFDATKYQPSAGPSFEALPSGNYIAAITRAEIKQTKSGDGSYLELELTVQDGEYKNQKLFERLNIQNKSEKTVDFAKRRLSLIAYVVNKLQFQDTQELIGIPFQVVVTKEARKDDPTQYNNSIKNYMTLDGSEPGKSGTVAQPSSAPAWAGNGAGNGAAPNVGGPKVGAGIPQSPAGPAPAGASASPPWKR